MEFVSTHDISQAEVAAAAPGGTIEREIGLPRGASRWTLQIVPKHAGGAASNPSTELLYDVGGDEFFPVSPSTLATATKNLANVITREDAISRFKLRVTIPAGPKIDGDILVRLFVDRGGA